mgnify:CR=1 FL=1
MDAIKQIQEDEYDFPYHYIPKRVDSSFSWSKYWSWSFQYLGGIDFTLEQLGNIKFDSLIDIGCGDGRFLREVHSRYSNVRAKGIDYSEKAIRYAKAFNPDLDYDVFDITKDSLGETYDVATLIEVIEHIEPSKLDGFIKSISKMLSSNSYLMITVPHTNKQLSPKHYQHFNSKKLKELLEKDFDIQEIVPFDKKSKLVKLVLMLIGGKGNWFVLSNEKILGYLYNYYRKKYLKCNESDCLRIAVIAKRK